MYGLALLSLGRNGRASCFHQGRISGLNHFMWPGVHSILVSLMAQRAEVKYDPAYVLPSQIAAAITDLGFSSKVNEAEGLGQGTVDLTVGIHSHTYICGHTQVP